MLDRRALVSYAVAPPSGWLLTMLKRMLGRHRIRDFLQQTIDEAELDYLLARFASGDITGAEAANSLALFTCQEMPDITAHKRVV